MVSGVSLGNTPVGVVFIVDCCFCSMYTRLNATLVFFRRYDLLTDSWFRKKGGGKQWKKRGWDEEEGGYIHTPYTHTQVI